MTNERPRDEGWIPSRGLLIDLLNFAPEDWYERLASLMLREGFFKDAPTWLHRMQEVGYGLGQVDMMDLYLKEAAKLVDEHSILEGHDAGPDLGLLWRQLIAEDQTRFRNREVSLDLNLRSQRDVRRFLDGEIPATITIPSVGVRIEVTGPELVNRLVQIAPRVIYVDGPDGMPGWPQTQGALEDRRVWALETLDAWLSSLLWGGKETEDPHARIGVHLAMYAILQGEGYQRGPCPSCGRAEWYVAEPKPKGRPPLVYKYCPPCVELIKREQKAAHMRKARAEEQGKHKPSAK